MDVLVGYPDFACRGGRWEAGQPPRGLVGTVSCLSELGEIVTQARVCFLGNHGQMKMGLSGYIQTSQLFQ